MIFLALCILILLAIRRHISLGYAPELEQKSIAVAFDYYGAYEKEVEILVSRIEEVYMELDGIKSINSVSEPGRGYIFCLFSDKINLDEAYVQISDITAHVWASFPEGVNRPVITKSSNDDYPIYISYFSLEMRPYADRIKEAYEAVSGVGDVLAGSQEKKELMIELHTDRLSGSLLSSQGLDSKLRSSNLACKVAMPGEQTLILSSRLSSISEFGQVQVAPDLKLSDIAELEYTDAKTQNIGHIDGQPALLFFVRKSGEGNTVQLCRQLKNVTSHFGGNQFYNLGDKIEKSFIFSSLIFLLLFIFLLSDLWFKTKRFHIVLQIAFQYIFSLLVAIAAVTSAGFQVDMTVMVALFFVLCYPTPIMELSSQFQNKILHQYNESINTQDIATLRSIGRKSINDFTSEDIQKTRKWAYKFWQQLGKKSPFFRRFFGDWREDDTSNVNQLEEIKLIKAQDQNEAVAYIKKKVKDSTLFRGDKTNADTGFKINIGKQVYSDTVTYANRAYSRERKHDEHEAFNNYLAKVSILANIGDIVEKSILLDTQTIEKDKNRYRSFIHKFYNIAKIGNQYYIIKLAVDELNTDGNETKRAYNVDNIKISPIVVSRFFNSADTMGDSGSIASNLTVADLHALVKQFDKGFHPVPVVYNWKKVFALTAALVISIFVISLYTPIHLRNLILPFCITFASGLCASAVCQHLMKERTVHLAWGHVPLWCYFPILLFALFLFLSSSFSPFAPDVSFSLEYESGTSFHFVQKSALDIESELLAWNEFDRLTLHIDRGRASFTIIGGNKRDIMAKISELSSRYPEIFFYIPEKHTKNAIDVAVYGNNMPEIEDNILQMANYVNKSADNVNIIYNFKSDVTNIILEIPVKCISAGLYPYDVYKTLYYTASEPVIDKFCAGDVETDVKIRGAPEYRETLSGLLSVPIISPFGVAGEAGDYITVHKEKAQGRIYHKNRMRCLSFSATGISRTELCKIVSSFPFTGSCHGEVCQ